MILTMVVAAALQSGALPVQSVVRPGSPQQAPAASATRRPKAAPRVVVDAGHGGPDVGAPMQLTAKIYEKDVALQVALKVGDALQKRGVDVVYTRKTDTLIARTDRGRIANQSNADVFISIHVNAANPRWRDPGRARGFETYFLGVAKTEDARRVQEMEDESGRFESGGDASASDPLSFILSDMMQNEHLRESADLAEIVQRHLKQVHPGPDRGVKQAGFTVLIAAFMPAILVEIGFGTNAEEAQFLASQSKQRLLAGAIADATREYLQRHQKRVGGGSASSAYE